MLVSLCSQPIIESQAEAKQSISAYKLFAQDLAVEGCAVRIQEYRPIELNPNHRSHTGHICCVPSTNLRVPPSEKKKAANRQKVEAVFIGR